MCIDRPTSTGAELGRQVFDELLAANAKYLSGTSEPQSELSPPELRHELATHGQKPVAAIIACADSRVAPEIVFGAGIGKVFVVRNAGNVAWGDSVVGSLEYAVEHLGVPLVLVLGHTKCGAVGAAIGMAKDGVKEVQGHLGKHVEKIADVVKCCVEKDEAVAEAVGMNVKDGVSRLVSGSGPVGKAVQAGKVLVLGGVYDIDSGAVIEVGA